MDYVGKLSNLISSVSKVYNELNPATLSGAIDIVVVEQPNGELACSPFHVRFGKLSLLMPQEKKVNISFKIYNILTYLLRYDPHGSHVKAAAKI
jgi:phosphatidate phosphatase LPIN